MSVCFRPRWLRSDRRTPDRALPRRLAARCLRLRPGPATILTLETHLNSRKLILGLALTLSSACPLWANWGVVQQTASPQTGGTSVTARFPGNVTSGDLILVQAIWSSTTFGVTSVSDSLGNTYTSAAIAQGATSTEQISTQVFYATNVIGGQDQVTVTIGSGTYFNVLVYEIAGAATTNPIDVTAVGNGTGFSVTTASALTSAASDFVFVATGHHFGYDTPGAGFTGVQSTATSLGEYQTVAFSGTTVSGAATLSGTNPSLPWSAVLVALKSPPPSGGGTTATLTSIQILPASSTFSMGQNLQLSAIGTYSDNSTQDLTSTANWSSSNTGIISVSAAGLTSAVGHGNATITASSGSITGSTVMLVEGTLSSIQVTPASGGVTAGGSQQFTATGVFSDGTTENLTSSASWSSSNTAVGTVNNLGMVNTLSPGVVTITASTGGVSGSANLTVNAPIGVVSTPVVQTPLVQTNFQSSVQYQMQNPPTAGGNSCSPAPCIAQSFFNPNTAGNMIFVWVSWNTGYSLANLSDTAGNTYTHIPGFPSAAGVVDDFWVAYNINGSANNKVMGLFGSGTITPVYMQIMEFSGMATANAFDVNSIVKNHNQCVAPCVLKSAPTPVTTQAHELVLAVFDAGSGPSLNVGTGWTPEFACFSCMAWEADLSGQVVIEQQVVNSTGSYTAAINDYTNGWPPYDAYVFTFKFAN